MYLFSFQACNAKVPPYSSPKEMGFSNKQATKPNALEPAFDNYTRNWLYMQFPNTVTLVIIILLGSEWFPSLSLTQEIIPLGQRLCVSYLCNHGKSKVVYILWLVEWIYKWMRILQEWFQTFFNMLMRWTRVLLLWFSWGNGELRSEVNQTRFIVLHYIYCMNTFSVHNGAIAAF